METVQHIVLTDFSMNSAIWIAADQIALIIDTHSSPLIQPGHFKQTPSPLAQPPCSSQSLPRMASRIKLLIATCCLGPDMVPRQCQQPDGRTSLQVPRNRMSRCGKRFYCPRSLWNSLLATWLQAKSHHTGRLTDVILVPPLEPDGYVMGVENPPFEQCKKLI